MDFDDIDTADLTDRFEDNNREDAFELDQPMSNQGQQSGIDKQKLPLYCLPLYSMMPSFLQRRVFEPVPDGQR